MPLPDLARDRSACPAHRAALLHPGDVVALSGGLGAGKTTLARAIIAALGYAGEVPSPSFAIIEVYDPPALRLRAVHADFYRLEDPRGGGRDLGLDDHRADAVLIAEWPGHAGGFAIEPTCLSIRLEILENERVAIVEAGSGLARAQGMDVTLTATAPWLRMPCPKGPHPLGAARLGHCCGGADPWRCLGRRYFRLRRLGATAMLMHAPPPGEDPEPFLRAARWLDANGLRAPQIHAEDSGLRVSCCWRISAKCACAAYLDALAAG